MLELYVKEFCAICRAALDRYGVQKGDFVYISKEKLKEMMDRNAFEAAYNKMRVWRDLHWIDADKGHFTRNVILKNGERRKRMVKISLSVHQALERLLIPQQTYQSTPIE